MWFNRRYSRLCIVSNGRDALKWFNLWGTFPLCWTTRISMGLWSSQRSGLEVFHAKGTKPLHWDLSWRHPFTSISWTTKPFYDRLFRSVTMCLSKLLKTKSVGVCFPGTNNLSHGIKIWLSKGIYNRNILEMNVSDRMKRLLFIAFIRNVVSSSYRIRVSQNWIDSNYQQTRSDKKGPTTTQKHLAVACIAYWHMEKNH